MSWDEKTWAQWYGATQESEKSDLLAQTFDSEHAKKWIAYAQHLESELEEIKKQYSRTASKLTNDSYRSP